MKKTLRKLNLSRETLHNLENLPVGGARPESIENTCPFICDPVHLLTDIC